MTFVAVARSATMILRAASASILFYNVAAAVASAAAVDAAVCARRAVRSSGSVLRNVALIVKFLTLFH